jgi:hypothetical protein
MPVVRGQEAFTHRLNASERSKHTTVPEKLKAQMPCLHTLKIL